MSLDSYEKCWGGKSQQPTLHQGPPSTDSFQEKKNIPFPSQSFQISLHLREPQHYPLEHTPGLPKPPNERNSFINCLFWVWGMFQGYVGKFLDYSDNRLTFLEHRELVRPKSILGPWLLCKSSF